MNNGIRKITSIKSLGSFHGFNWDESVKNKDGSVLTLADINIIYGRNYSGKTTLSRIVRALQLKQLPAHYDQVEFEIEFADRTKCNQTLSQNVPISLRVFNQDFVCDNLSFLNDTRSDAGRIVPFAVIGETNNRLEKEIKALSDELGDNTPGKETGLYLQHSSAVKDEKDAQTAKDKIAREIESTKKRIVLDRSIGIKYQSGLYGDQNYTIPKFEVELQTVRDSKYQCPSSDECEQLKHVIKELPKQSIQVLHAPVYRFASLLDRTAELLSCKVVLGEKIKELLEDIAREKWVREGLKLHNREAACACLFCGNPISDERWDKLKAHFEDASERLNSDIEVAISDIQSELTAHENDFTPNKLVFYSTFHDGVDSLVEQYKSLCKRYNESLQTMIECLRKRQESLSETLEWVKPEDVTAQLNAVFLEYGNLCQQANTYTKELSEKQKNARYVLRLKRVYDADKENGLIKKEAELKKTEERLRRAQEASKDVRGLVDRKLSLIASKRREMNDETRAAELINRYLTWLGDHTFSLKAEKVFQDGIDTTYFKVFRHNVPAYNLSEGECSLIAFCYFLATLNDPALTRTKPVVWIDDPICSLDANHIYFVYAMIRNVIIADGRFEQLFISTHSLEFLRYLYRIKGWKNGQEYERQWLLVERTGDKSYISKMPEYMKNYMTEFSYLFKKIYICATTSITEEAYQEQIFDFGNAARKFLELYLYFKFPNSKGNKEKEHQSRMKDIFGDQVKSFMIDRVLNEASHLSGQLERGMTLLSAPETQQVARLILNGLKKEDEKQYHELLNGIGVASDPLENIVRALPL